MDGAVNYNTYLLRLIRSYALPTDRILDFGAGIGTFSHPLKRDGFDVSCVERAIQNSFNALLKNGIPGFSGLAAAPDETYDYIFTLNVLEHVEDDQSALRDLVRNLKLGGRPMIYVPAFQMLFSSMDRAVGHSAMLIPLVSLRHLFSNISVARMGH